MGKLLNSYQLVAGKTMSYTLENAGNKIELRLKIVMNMVSYTLLSLSLCLSLFTVCPLSLSLRPLNLCHLRIMAPAVVCLASKPPHTYTHWLSGICMSQEKAAICVCLCLVYARVKDIEWGNGSSGKRLQFSWGLSSCPGVVVSLCSAPLTSEIAPLADSSFSFRMLNYPTNTQCVGVCMCVRE